MGRAPGLALAYMLWCRGFELNDAYSKLLAVRHCHPKLAAIREATCDVLYSPQRAIVTINMPLSWAGGAQLIQVRWAVMRGRVQPCGLLEAVAL